MPFDSPDVNLGDLLERVQGGRVQLPDFQREWKWEDDRIKSLLASISLDYPIGVLMMLQIGGDNVRFKPRAVAGAEAGAMNAPEQLLLDGQQRVTSLFQSLKSGKAVDTADSRGKRLQRWYYVDIGRALDPAWDREDAILSVPRDRTTREDFGRKVVVDYSSLERETEAEAFPLSRAFDMGAVFEWQNRYVAAAERSGEPATQRWQRFYDAVLKNFIKYTVPVIVLTKETPKEAVCTVFEKVNTGGVVLNVFELLTATFAADDFRLNEDWRQRKERLSRRPALDSLESTDFLQAISLVATYQRRETAGDGAVSCRRRDILQLSLDDYRGYADAAEVGFAWAAEFMAREKIFRSRDVPYRTQMVPLAALRAIVGPSAVSGGHSGSAGQRPPRVSMARAIKASGVRNP